MAVVQDFHRKLYRICFVLCIRNGRIYFGFLCFSVFEEVSSYLREQCVGQNVLILLVPCAHLAFKVSQLVPGSGLPDGR